MAPKYNNIAAMAVMFSLFAMMQLAPADAAIGYITDSLGKNITVDAGTTQTHTWTVINRSLTDSIDATVVILQEASEFVTVPQSIVKIEPNRAYEVSFEIAAPKYNGVYEAEIMASEAPSSDGASVAAVGVFHRFTITVQNGEERPPEEPEVPVETAVEEPVERTGGLVLSGTPDMDPEPTPEPEPVERRQCGPGTELVNGICMVLENPQDSNEGGGCLIATAAYGTELAPQVQLLREIRDSQLMQTASGTSFMESFNGIYYVFSPGIADMQRQSPVFKEAVKLFITPMLSTMSVMENADGDASVISLGALVIGLNGAIYAGLPALGTYLAAKRIRAISMR